MFTENIGEDYHNFPALADPADERKAWEDRARSYLDVNCSQCHRPEGTGRSGFDLRASTPLPETQLLDLIAAFGDLGTEDGGIVRTGSPENSVLYLRMTRTDEFRMPPLASTIVDELGTQVVYVMLEASILTLILNSNCKQSMTKNRFLLNDIQVIG